MTTSKFLESALNDARYPRDKIQALIESGKPSPIPNKLAFDRKVLRAMNDAIDSILEWGQVCPDFESLMYAREKLANRKKPNNGNLPAFAALIDLTRGQPDPELERLLMS